MRICSAVDSNMNVKVCNLARTKYCVCAKFYWWLPENQKTSLSPLSTFKNILNSGYSRYCLRFYSQLYVSYPLLEILFQRGGTGCPEISSWRLQCQCKGSSHLSGTCKHTGFKTVLLISPQWFVRHFEFVWTTFRSMSHSGIRSSFLYDVIILIYTSSDGVRWCVYKRHRNAQSLLRGFLSRNILRHEAEGPEKNKLYNLYEKYVISITNKTCMLRTEKI